MGTPTLTIVAISKWDFQSSIPSLASEERVDVLNECLASEVPHKQEGRAICINSVSSD